MALGWLGQSSISSLFEASTTAQLCNLNYDEARKAVLEEGIWSFAQKRFHVATPSVKDDNMWGSGFYFLVPNGMLRIREIYDSPDMADVNHNWTVEGAYIVADKPEIWGVGVYNVEPVSNMSAAFRSALAARLAAEIAIPITQSQTLAADMWNLYEDKLNRAAVIDASQSRRAITHGRGRMSTARYTGPAWFGK
jgi:hypothetical protein